MSVDEKKQAKMLVVKYFIRYLKEKKKYYLIPIMCAAHPFHKVYANTQSDTAILHYQSLKNLLNAIEGNHISSHADLKEYITLYINSLLNIFLDNKGLYSTQDLFTIGKGIYDKVCTKIFGKDYQEESPKSIDELCNLNELFSFLQNEYLNSQNEQTVQRMQISYVDFLKQYFRSYRESLLQWAVKNNISFLELNDFVNNIVAYASKN